ncbi:unnamed protein product [marine sediment metagenome]|uniref:Uncharacterized protein n=1 Tax=marine sediment metagenome TaxID=412755 RepID=X1IDL2_9ZZZZ
MYRDIKNLICNFLKGKKNRINIKIIIIASLRHNKQSTEK